MKKLIFLLPLLLLFVLSCDQLTPTENHDPNPLVSPESISITSGDATQTVRLVCSENPDGAYLYDEDGDTVTVVVDPETPLPDSISLNEETGVLTIIRTSNISGTLSFWTEDNNDGTTEDQPLTVSYDITQWTADPGTSSVYVAGYYTESSRMIASYWEDGVKVDLHTDNGHDSEADSIYVYNSDIYVAGYYNDGSVKKACYWKNGVEVELDLSGIIGLGHSEATGVFVDSGVIYISGHYLNSSGQTACYWYGSSGTLTRVDIQTAENAQAEDIFRSNNITYTTGYYGPDSSLKPSYWVDSSVVDLPYGSASDGLGSSIVTSGSDLYIAGTVGNKSCYWIDADSDGSGISLTVFNTASNSYGKSIALFGSNIYVAGRYWDSSYTAAYWTVSGATLLTDLKQDSSGSGSANSVSVTSSEIYFAGFDIVSSGTSTACYWKKSSPNEKVVLHSSSNAEAHSIFVDS